MLKTIIISCISINELNIFEKLVARWIFMVSKFITDTLLLEYKITSYTLKIDLSKIARVSYTGQIGFSNERVSNDPLEIQPIRPLFV